MDQSLTWMVLKRSNIYDLERYEQGWINGNKRNAFKLGFYLILLDS